MKQSILLLMLVSFWVLHPYELEITQTRISPILDQTDRKLSDEEVQKRGLDLLATEIIEKIDTIDLKKTARSAIFETSYGFRWKMINLHTGNIIIIKVNKNFELISARNSKRQK